jgi:hypothetical protein
MTNISEFLTKPWQKFLTKVSEYKDLDLKAWKEPQILGYFLFKYEEKYNRKFALSFKGPPSKCSEIILIKKLYVMLDVSKAKEVKEYIDWVFETKLEKFQIKSIGFLVTNSLVNDYLKTKNKPITKTTELPDEFKEVVKMLDLSVETYGDVAFIKSAVDQNPDDESRKPYKDMLHMFTNLGFDFKYLDTLK